MFTQLYIALDYRVHKISLYQKNYITVRNMAYQSVLCSAVWYSIAVSIASYTYVVIITYICAGSALDGRGFAEQTLPHPCQDMKRKPKRSFKKGPPHSASARPRPCPGALL